MKILFTLLFICPVYLFAQGNYKPGYIVTLNGDTIKGYIDYLEWPSNPKQISFRKTATSTTNDLFAPANARAFGINGYTYYKTFSGKISLDNTETGSLSKGIDSAQKLDTVFLKVVTSGKNVILYEYTDNIKRRYFISAQGATPIELIYRKYLDADNPSKVMVQSSYRLQLRRLAANYQPQHNDLAMKIQDAEYSSDIKNIVDAINGPSKDNLFTSADQNKNTRFFVGLGLNNTSSTFGGSNPLTAANSYSSTFPIVTLGLDIYLDKNVGKVLLRSNLGFTTGKAAFSYNGMGIEAFTTIFKFNQYTAYLNPEILYNFYNGQRFKFYAALGFGINYSQYTDKQYYTVYSPTSIQTQNINYESIYVNFSTKIGIALNNRFDIFVAYYPQYSIVSYDAYSLNCNTYRAGINYLFGSNR